MLHIPPTNLLFLPAYQESRKKVHEEFTGKKLGEWNSMQKKKDKTERVTWLSRRTREEIVQNDNPEIPDKGELSDIPGLPWGSFVQKATQQEIHCRWHYVLHSFA